MKEKNNKATAKVNNQGYGCLIKRQSGVYDARVKANGCVYSKSTRCTKEDEAQAALAAFVSEIRERNAA